MREPFADGLFYYRNNGRNINTTMPNNNQFYGNEYKIFDE